MPKKNAVDPFLIALLAVLGAATIGGGIALLASANNKNAQKQPLLTENSNDADAWVESDFYNTDDLEEFKTAMHAFVSLVSMEKIGCEFIKADDPGCYTCITQHYDPGWPPASFHYFLQKISSCIYNLSPEASTLLTVWKRHSELCCNFFENQEPDEHVNLLKSLFQTNNVVIYPWGADSHRVYIELKKKEHNCYRIRIFDLGAGRTAIRAHYQPIEYDQLNSNEFSEKVTDFLNSYNGYLSSELLENLYGAEKSICTSCLPEYAQNTGNCVVKNFLAAIQQDSVDRYGHQKGLAIFTELYVALLSESLTHAEAIARPYFSTPLPEFHILCESIENCHLAFTGISKRILHPISEKYNKVRNLSLKSSVDQNIQFNTCSFNSDVSMFSMSSTFFDGLESERDTGPPRNFIIKIEESLLIRRNLEAAIGKKFRDSKYENIFKRVPNVAKNELTAAYQNFLQEIQLIETLHLRVDDNIVISQDNFFRIDCAGSGLFWKLELQDNTNVTQKIENKPISSIFAVIKISKENTYFSGKLLSKYISESQSDAAEKIINDSSTQFGSAKKNSNNSLKLKR